MNEQEQKRSSNRGIIGALAAFLVLALAALAYFIYSGNAKNKEIERVQVTVDSLEQVRNTMASDLALINKEYELIAIENDSLKGSLENSKEIIANKDKQIWRAQNSAKKSVASLKAEIASIDSARSQVESRISELQNENKQLKDENAALQKQVAELGDKNATLTSTVDELNKANDVMSNRMEELINSAFKASAMQVDFMKGNDRLTTKGKRGKKISVGFDLVDVPEEFQGQQNIYLAMTDANGVAIAENTSKVKVGEGPQALVIEAMDTKKVNLGETQRLEFNHELSDKLNTGFYIVSVYTDKGLLGSSILKLR